MTHGPATRPLQFGWETSRSTESVASFHPSKIAQISNFIHHQNRGEGNKYLIVGSHCFLDLKTLSRRQSNTRYDSTLYLLPRSVPTSGRTFDECPMEIIETRHLPYRRR